jgi:hypothetical protein
VTRHRLDRVRRPDHVRRAASIHSQSGRKGWLLVWDELTVG